MILTVTLNAALARTLVVPSLTFGHRHRAPTSVSLAGGKGINVARGLRALGVPVLATGFAGGRNGDAIRDGLSEAAIPFDLVEISGESRNSVAIVDPMNGVQTEINEHGPEVSPTEAREFFRRFEYLMEYADVVVFAGSVPPGLEESYLTSLVDRARERGLFTVVDSTPTVLKAALRSKPSLVSPNQHEAESVAGFDFMVEEDFPRGLSRLTELGAESACITSPEGHSYFKGKEGVISALAPIVERTSTIGSGDAYLAGLLCGTLYRKLGVVEAVRLAAGCAAANAEMPGACLFDPPRAEELASQVEVEVLSGGLQQSPGGH
ncbi:1-PFK: hexose kinase, 1-phosphofructokinase family [Rubrobacter radiotolerans]|uniref:Hexose kinase n=1 Tax=Rubrobacter radiotolerans TaxID=42256 RepID=A0A023X0Q2_RUBRA|nr:hexose kinase [Rubrobacter radiotolerans]AHY45801.1 1-PFK: hexose kinase, 1-phosphofructokinase family [Rubrobacter radiotolerans]MDX5893215.1 hexose kinase [Rubrobacter radiotolerans]SMC03290.1 1-phosphofructokinase [Rubrobacter radiotolerans DSM 5868]